jgi:hypothetical protein
VDNDENTAYTKGQLLVVDDKQEKNPDKSKILPMKKKKGKEEERGREREEGREKLNV